MTRGSKESEKVEVRKELRQIIGSIAIVIEPLSTRGLAQLSKISVMNIDQILQDLGLVLDFSDNEHECIGFLHPSFHDFLLDRR
jgi:hypothetical protein